MYGSGRRPRLAGRGPGLLRQLAGGQFHGESGDAGPSLALTMFDVKRGRRTIVADPPVGGRDGWTLQDERFGAGLFDGPGFAGVGRFVQLVTVAIARLPPVDNQTAAVFRGKRELLNGAKTVLVYRERQRQSDY